jgi:hypothetical protein
MKHPARKPLLETVIQITDRHVSIPQTPGGALAYYILCRIWYRLLQDTGVIDGHSQAMDRISELIALCFPMPLDQQYLIHHICDWAETARLHESKEVAA